MLTDEEALQKAESDYQINGSPDFRTGFRAALTWLRSQGEPVAWMNPDERLVYRAFAWKKTKSYPSIATPVYLAPQPAIPDGYRLVPAEPTPEMVKAMQDMFWTGKSTYSLRTTDAYRVFFAMLAATPEPSK